jgi:serine/threonine protein kinase
MTVQQPSGDDPTAFRPAPQIEASLQLAPGAILGGRYRIVSLVGSGGMGQVYRADDLKLGQTVALKFLAHQGSAGRIYEEVRVGRQISHPNVCRLYDIAEVDGHLFITMEFVDGEDLASLLRRIGRLPSEKALMLTRDICAGLAAAHEKGVIHRDLKPANVMIDGRGRARVTDFGLALAGESASDGAGTPAYMAPEQLAGAPASVKSDIYALGLVFYEIFTGRRTFDSTSLQDLMARQQRGDFTRPTSITRDVPAAVERIIVRCLDVDPRSRPASVDDILRELPGGDPLAAAIAAGETPSPAMVAAAFDRGELSPRVAWAILGVQVAVLILYAALTARTMLYRQVPLKSPDVLQERVTEVLNATGQNLPRADWSAVFVTDQGALDWIARHGAPPSSMSPILFLHRQSPRPMLAQNYEHRVLSQDPPLMYSGMSDVALDSNGRLVQLTIFPPQTEPSPARSTQVDWTPFLKLTGLAGKIAPAVPQWAAPVDSDAKAAWTVGSDGTRVEAASYHGRPVWFFVIPPWRVPARMAEPQPELGDRIATAVVVLINVVFWAAAIALALRNSRRGQGDRPGARRLAAAVFAIVMTGTLLLAHHVDGAFEEMVLISSLAGLVLLMTAAACVGYMAIEPLVRRRWPRMLIAVSRFLAGRLRDPMIGRELLVGSTAGLALVLLRQLIVLYPGTPPIQSASLTLSGLRYVGWFAAASLTLAIVGPIFAATLIVGLHVITRSIRVSIIIFAFLAAMVVLGDVPGPLWLRVLFGLLVGSTVLIVIFRFGLLAYGAGVFSYLFIRRVPITLDPSAWYFGRSLFTLLLLTAVAVYAFVVSLGGKRWLPEVSVDA